MTYSVTERRDQPPLLILVITDDENNEMMMNASAENLTTLQNSDINAKDIIDTFTLTKRHGTIMTSFSTRDF